MSQFFNDSIFWIEVEKVKPNPYQPRREFDEAKLNDLAESIRQYGILQPLVVTRRELQTEEGGLSVEYELIAGERRLRASRIAGLGQVPVIIRGREDDDRIKLELAIVENLQREDLNPMDRARAFERLIAEFKFKHIEIAKKVGKSRVYVSNSVRLLALPQEMQDALSRNDISEGHTRPILMLCDRPEEQSTLFKEILYKKMSVRDAESIARRIAFDKVKNKIHVDPEIVELEERLTESLGTRVRIERKNSGGKITIDFFSENDLNNILNNFNASDSMNAESIMRGPVVPPVSELINEVNRKNGNVDEYNSDNENRDENQMEENAQIADDTVGNEDIVSSEEGVVEKDKGNGNDNDNDNDEDIYSIKNFSI